MTPRAVPGWFDCIPMPAMWYCGPDYIRLTCSRDDPRYTAAEARYAGLQQQIVHRWHGDTVRSELWRWQGYVGRALEGTAYGVRDDGCILQASGQAAEDVREVAGLPYTGIPRLDIALTMWYEDDNPHMAQDCGIWANRAARSQGRKGWKCQLRGGYGQGDTLYLGSRLSRLYVRVYDKWREAQQDEAQSAEYVDGYRYAWRIEVELKNGAAEEPWAMGDMRSVTPEAWLGVLEPLLYSRGLRLPSLAPIQRLHPSRVPRPISDTQRRMHWLRKQVAPSILRLRQDGVSDASIADALSVPIDVVKLIRDGGHNVDA